MPLDPAFSWYPWNFSPLMALSVFAGTASPRLGGGSWFPLTVLLLSDVGLGWLTGRWDWAFPRTQIVVYMSFVLGSLLGRWVRPRAHWSTGVAAGWVAECQFFLFTNAAVWWFGGGIRYPLDAAGLLACYVAALPFVGRSFLSTTLFSLILFRASVLNRVGVQPQPYKLITVWKTA